jgi:hypothetical protein
MTDRQITFKDGKIIRDEKIKSRNYEVLRWIL